MYGNFKAVSNNPAAISKISRRYAVDGLHNSEFRRYIFIALSRSKVGVMR